MPTHEEMPRFTREFRQLNREQRRRFIGALRRFIAVLEGPERAGRTGLPRFPASLGVKRMVNRGGIWEFAWAPDGRCTWEYGEPARPGLLHIRWRRIGTHTIYDDP